MFRPRPPLRARWHRIPHHITGNLTSDQKLIASGYREEWTDISKSPTSRVACGVPAINTVIKPHVVVNVATDVLGKEANPATHELNRGPNANNPTPLPPGGGRGSDK